jgi:diguanylate cyclase (GGDEF)-like protein
MGKSSLLLRMVAHAQDQNIAVCTVDFLQVDRAMLASTDQLLRWLCKTMARQLDLPLDLELYWDSDIGSKVSCTICIEQGLLKSLTAPVMLSMQNLDPVFAHPDVAADLLSLLRSWYEQSRRSPLWQKLRLVLSYTAEACIPLKLEQSPFNVGLPLKLLEFTPDQVHDLASRYDLQRHLDGDYGEVMAALLDLVGGHPYLTHLAIAHLHRAPSAPFDLLASASNPTGIYGHHLRYCLATVRQQPELVEVIRALTQADDGLKLSAPLTYQLDNLGIIKLQGNLSSLSCRLYQRVFTAEFFEDAAAEAEDDESFARALSRLEQANQRLQTLAYTDGLTRIPNRRAFDVRLRQVWQQMAQNQLPLTLMLCDIDYFKQYNDTHGHPVGDRCLTLVAKTLRSNVRDPTDFVFRYGGEEFAVILTQADTQAVHGRAEAIRSQVSLKTRQSVLPGVTISVGAVIVTNAENRDPHQMVQEADHALYESKRLGRDRITFRTLP